MANTTNSKLNKGRALLEKMGWQPGSGLGRQEQGMKAPLHVKQKAGTHARIEPLRVNRTAAVQQQQQQQQQQQSGHNTSQGGKSSMGTSIAEAAAAAVKLAQQGGVEHATSKVTAVPTIDNPFGDPFQPRDVLEERASATAAAPVMINLGDNAHYIIPTMMRLLDSKACRFEARLEDDFDCKAFFDLGVAGTLVVVPIEGHNVTANTVASAAEFIREDVIPRCLTPQGISDLWEEYGFGSSRSRIRLQQEEDSAAVENAEWLRKVEAYQPRAHKGKGGIGAATVGDGLVSGTPMLHTPIESSERSHFIHGQTIDPEDSEPVVSNLVKIPEKVSQVVTRRLQEIKMATKIVDIKISSTPQAGQRSVMLKGTKNRIQTVKDIFMEFRASAADRKSATLDNLLNAYQYTSHI
ncbi:hypothetical protein Pmar_PMAR003015 [Perkinsus marinus ATCC 50983]|uniref:G-patch domain-containing protein n=1 Tax=Perkinsus marinus (strain ATCC 50983 / TXsc) TaxID=423536 RepID=C5LR59_PERM5|nr:hypothetical protein Pmar_PMAR003015 [Perkinsus marinus ATCC 50983]EER00944.1 hypothetical protein Pmar_PMAR003015 [Perkinsus marinus ATCC 50983]|eukprot:XP_002768226.1 hypothetical protein Pmar_PMAR003015 [Perkinsus marinus ATCC 50983]